MLIEDRPDAATGGFKLNVFPIASRDGHKVPDAGKMHRKSDPAKGRSSFDIQQGLAFAHSGGKPRSQDYRSRF